MARSNRFSNKSERRIVYNIISNVLGSSKKIRADDKFCEGLSHLESKEYMNPWKLYKQMEVLEDSHNQKVSDFMKETEEKIRTSIANDNEILLEERKGFNLAVVYSINLSQAPEPTQDFYKFVQQTYFGYGLSSIFEHLVKKSMISDDSTLDVGTFETGLGYLLPKLTSRYTDKIIALSLLSTRERIIKLKDFINSVPPDTINKLGEFNGNIENLRNLLKSFLSCIEKIIYDKTSLGLAGQCEKENRLRFSSIVANAIRSFRPHF